MKRLIVLVLWICAAAGVRAAADEPGQPRGANPRPQAAIPAVLAAFDKFDVVGMPAAHGSKDLDDFILALVRAPGFAAKVNDIEVECGNSLYQALLDRYIAGEDMPFT